MLPHEVCGCLTLHQINLIESRIPEEVATRRHLLLLCLQSSLIRNNFSIVLTARMKLAFLVTFPTPLVCAMLFESEARACRMENLRWCHDQISFLKAVSQGHILGPSTTEDILIE